MIGADDENDPRLRRPRDGDFAVQPAVADALPQVDRADLHGHCADKYRPRGYQALADPYTEPMVGQLRCRIPAVVGGFTIENQSESEVCNSRTGSPRWSAAGNRVLCGGGASTSVIAPGPVAPNPLQMRCMPPRRWVRVGNGFTCR